MIEISATVTVGAGSERHNHDLDYRETLEHVHSRPEGVIELIPYRDYAEQINEMMKPYIDEYNEKLQARYEAAWERYNAGITKTKPRKRDYKPMSYDYVSEHLNDLQRNPHTGKQEEVPMFRSLILGIGDRADRREGRVTEEQAKAVFSDVVRQFREEFPAFRLLGASLHLDEEGFYHCHLDYKPIYEKEATERGLSVGIGQEAALERMGFRPEQSIINARDKAPILFNAFRNKLYYCMEASMAEQGLRLQYGVSKTKEPDKDSSKNQDLGSWQAQQDAARDMQHLKNIMLETVAADKVSPEGYKAAIKAATDIENTLVTIGQQKRSRLNKDNVVVHFRLFDQLRSFIKELVETIRHLLHKIDILSHNVDVEIENCAYWKSEAERLQPYEEQYRLTKEELRKKNWEADRMCAEMSRSKKFMDALLVDGVSVSELYEQFKIEEAARQAKLAKSDPKNYPGR